MLIKINFLNGSQYWQNLVTQNAERASAILSDPAFIQAIRAHSMFDFCADTPAQVADKIAQAGLVEINVSFYKGWIWSKAIAYEDAEGVHFNTRKLAYGAGSVDNIVHECMHAPPFNYSHNGNSAAGNQNTAPYWIGHLADNWIVKANQVCASCEAVMV